MNKIIIRLFVIGFFSILAFIYTFPWSVYNINMPFSGGEYKLGLDLQGGIELDYKVDLDQAKQDKDYDRNKEKSIIEGLKSIVDKRIEALKISDSVITTASYGGEQHIIVQIPLKGNNSLENSDNIKKAKEAIGKVVKIEFKEKREKITDEDKKQRKELANQAIVELKNSKYDFFVTANKYRDSYENVEVGTLTGTKDDLKNYFSLDYSNLKIGIQTGIISGTGKSLLIPAEGTFVQTKGKEGYYVLDYLSGSTNTIGTGKVYEFNYLFLTKSPGDWISAKDKKGRILNDKYFLKSSVQYNNAFQPMVELTFNDEGAEIFGELTTRLIGKEIAIFVGGHLLTSPTVNDPILGGKAVITGTYTPEEAKNLSQDINTGVVPAPIYLTSEKTIDSRLGSNSLEKLIYSGIAGFILIFLFLTIVYRSSGIAASKALFIYILLVLAFVKAFGIVLTLASIAGLILSVGMAIDANILIFERIKDELRDGKTMEDSLNEGFKSSFSAIWDSHLTGLLVSTILFIFGINLIKGFGLMLGLGIIISLFTAMYVSKVFVIFLAKLNISKKLFVGFKK